MSSESLRKRFSIFKKKPTEEQPVTFDENSFDFSLKGGPFQSSLVEASATLKVGKHKGAPLPLHCTWYRSARDADFVVIEGVTGAFYQPNADDVGCKICVHAMPVSEVEEYTGMPAFAEVGPLELDPEVRRNVQEYLLNGATFPVTVLSGLPQVPGPAIVLINISSELVVIADETNAPIASYPVNSLYPQIAIDSKSNCLFWFSPDPDLKIEVSCSDAVYRDTIALTARMCCGAKVAKDRADLYLQLQQLNCGVSKALKEKEALASQLAVARQALEGAEGVQAKCKLHVEQVEAEMQQLRDKGKDLENELETNRQEVKFLRQDLNVYKNQCTLLEQKLVTTRESKRVLKQLASKTAAQLDELVKRVHSTEEGLMLADTLTALSCNLQSPVLAKFDSSVNSSVKSERLSEEGSTEGPDSSEERFLAEIKDLKEALALRTSEVDSLRSEMTERLNKIQAEKNFYKRKVDSFAQENDKLLTKLGKNPKEISAFEQSKQEFEAEKQRLRKENEAAQSHANFYLHLMETTERKLAEETRRNEELRILARHKSKAGSKEFHHIINSLTQTLTEREAELGVQKEINRSLLNRLAELQAIATTVRCKD